MSLNEVDTSFIRLCELLILFVEFIFLLIRFPISWRTIRKRSGSLIAPLPGAHRAAPPPLCAQRGREELFVPRGFP